MITLSVIILTTVLIIKFCIIPYFKNRDNERLNQNYIVIYPQRQRVRIDYTQKIDGFYPYVVDCFYTDSNTGREFCFISKPFLSDPTPYINGPIPIFVNPIDFSNYYVQVPINN